jgi:hypothetical protein
MQVHASNFSQLTNNFLTSISTESYRKSIRTKRTFKLQLHKNITLKIMMMKEIMILTVVTSITILTITTIPIPNLNGIALRLQWMINLRLAMEVDMEMKMLWRKTTGIESNNWVLHIKLCKSK